MDISKVIKSNKRIAFIAIVLLVIVFILAVFSLGSENDFTFEEFEPLEKGQAEIVNIPEIFEYFTPNEINQIYADINYFAENTETYYYDSLGGVLFLGDNLSSTNDSVTISGQLEHSSGDIELIVWPKNNERIRTSITNLTYNTNIDSELPSRNSANQFIAELPIFEEFFDISYIPENSVLITIYEREPDLYDQAYRLIEASVKPEDMHRLDIATTFPSPTFSSE